MYKYKVNEKFFDEWTPQMAYLLGFTYADGNIYKTTLSWDIQTRDAELLVKFIKILDSTYPLSYRRKSVRLRISSRKFINSAIRRGLQPKKNIRNVLPHIPKEQIRHFVRGYLEGDGWVVVRKAKDEGDIGFVSGNEKFLKDLNNIIYNNLHISGKLRSRSKVTPKGFVSTTYLLEFYSSKAFKLASWVYASISGENLFLQRKYEKYLEMKNLYDYLNSGTKVVREIQKKFGYSLKELLDELSVNQKLDGVQIAEVLDVHSSSVYRWLAQTDIRYPIKRKIKYE